MASPKKKQQPQEVDNPDLIPGPSSEEIVAGTLLELLEEQGLQPFDLVSSRPGASIPNLAIPNWFRKLSASI